MTRIVELEWGSIDYIDNIAVRLAETDSGFLIASVENPRFCFHGETEHLARHAALRGIRFWRQACAKRDQAAAS